MRRSLMPARHAAGRRAELAGSEAHGQLLARLRGADRGSVAQRSPMAGRHSRARRPAIPTYRRPSVLVMYREDHKFLLDTRHSEAGPVRPRTTTSSLPRSPGARACRPSSRRRRCSRRWHAASRRAAGCSPSSPRARIRRSRSIQKVWPGENPFQVDRHALLAALQGRAGARGPRLPAGCAAGRQVDLPLPDAHAAVGDLRPHRHVDAVRGMECRDLRQPDRGRAARVGR